MNQVMTNESNQRYNIARRSRIDRRFYCVSHQKKHPEKRIIGVDISDEQVVAALKLGVIDESADSFIDGAKKLQPLLLQHLLRKRCLCLKSWPIQKLSIRF